MNATPRSSARDWIVLGARILLGAAFIALGAIKASDPVAFMKGVREYDVFAPGSRGLTFVAVVLPWLEILLGTCLVLGIALRGAALVTWVLLAAFTTAILHRAFAIHAAQGGPFCAIAFDCGCGTGVERVCRKVPENLVLFVLATVILVSGSARFALRPRLLSAS